MASCLAYLQRNRQFLDHLSHCQLVKEGLVSWSVILFLYLLLSANSNVICKSFQLEVDNAHLKKRSDPYEFEDDMTAPAVSMEGFKRTTSVKVCVINKHLCTKPTLCSFLGYQNYILSQYV